MTTYERRKAAGICVWCGRNPARPGRTKCEECAMKERAYWNHGGVCGGDCDSCPYPDCVSPGSKGAVYRERRRAAGMCVTCGSRPAREGLATCEKCAARQEAYNRELRVARKAAGMCLRCGKRPPAPGTGYCADCTERRRESKRRELQKRTEAGLCTRCGRNPASPGMATCGACRERENERAGAKGGSADDHGSI